jgi:hypothetical protein
MKTKILRLTLTLTILPTILALLQVLQLVTPVTRATSQRTTVTYTPTVSLFPNPGRGFYHHTETHSGNYTPLNPVTLQSYRQDDVSLILRVFYLEDFVNSNISQTYLSAMQTDFDTIREAGLKVIIRFAYTDQLHFAPGTDWPPIPPYGDATKKQILKHLEQLRPVLQANSDVIAAMQAGFIGVWGEWHYTDHFVQDPGNPGNVTPEDWANRREVLLAILDVLPNDRMVQVRTPLIKQEIFTRTIPITDVEAYNASQIARVGFHNDCFLASDTDFGTYISPTIEYPYLAAETQYLPMGGETCNPNPPRSQCPTALDELELFHWTYLNADYHPDVLASWDTGVAPHDCLDEVKRQLGPRFTLVEGTYSNEMKAGDTFSIDLKLKNEGWAAPFNPRLVELLLRHTTSGVIYEVTLPEDPRFWLADDGTTHSLTHTICTPTDMPFGDYELLLNLPDPKLLLYLRPEYAIRLANEGVWEENTGYNKLLHTISVNKTATGSACNSLLALEIRDNVPLDASKVYFPIIMLAPTPTPTATPIPTATPMVGVRYQGPALLVSQTETEIIAKNISSGPVAIRVSWDGQDPFGTGDCPISPEDCFIDNWVEPGEQVQGKIKNHFSVQIWAWGTDTRLVDSCDLRTR